MKLERISAIVKKIAEAEITKEKARFKAKYFTRNRKMRFSSLTLMP